ncbi:MAG: transglutaminase domain-containing protein [Oscillospiraceae bacterium]|nr:transglutaminase domain-containing protein [Oscillospiraceae bacterium]
MKQKKSIAVYQFPYYKTEKGFIRILLTKALFACALAFSGAGLFTVLLELDVEVRTYGSYDWLDPLLPALLATAVCLVTILLLGFFPRLYVLIFDIAVFILIFFKLQLPQSGQDLLYQIFRVADGSFIKTAGILSQSELRDPIPFFMALVFVYGMLCAFSSCQRFRPLAVLTFAEIMMIPAFLGQSLHFSWWMAVLIADVFGMWTVTVAAAGDAVLSSGYSSNLHMTDYVYLKANKKLSPKDRLRSDSLHFGKHLSHCFTMFIVALLTLGITASTFPENGSLRLDEITDSAMSITQDIGYWLYGVFGGSGLRGFFSADGGNISISGNIDPSSLPTGNRAVAEIITENKDKLYLRGDIGYRFEEDQWKSIAGLDYGGISYNGFTMEQVLNSYAPEMQYYLMRCRLTRDLYNGTDYIKMQTVKVNYLQDINTLLIAGPPYVFNNFRENNNFSIYGDFVAVADRGRVNSMRSAVMYCPDDDETVVSMMAYRDYNDMADIRYEWDTLSMPVSYDRYSEYIDSYREFVYDYYTEIPEAEIGNIEGFLHEVFDDDNFLIEPGHAEDRFVLSSSLGHFSSDEMYGRSYFSFYIRNYLSSSGKYKYSLDTDNSAGNNTFLGNFLNTTKAGHCALYATTMCLALRYIGVPARYVTGFTVADADDYNKDEKGYSYTLLEKDLHAWVEVYYDDVGWVPYDPTPGRGGAGPSPAVTTTTSTTPPATTPSETSSFTRPTETTTTPSTTTTTRPAEPSGSLSDGGADTDKGIDPETVKVILIAAGVIIAVLAVAMSIAGALKTLRRKERTLIRFFRTGEAAEAVSSMFTFTLKILEMKGVRRRSGETPTEFAKRADHSLNTGLGVGLEQAMPLFERAEFDNEPVFGEEERQAVYGAVSELYAELMLNKKWLSGLFTRIRLFGRVKLRGKEK